jgi:hypothetical protein
LRAEQRSENAWRECQEATYARLPEASSGSRRPSTLACSARLPLLRFPSRSLAPSAWQTASITKADHTFQGLPPHPWYMPASEPSRSGRWLTVHCTSVQGKGESGLCCRPKPAVCCFSNLWLTDFTLAADSTRSSASFDYTLDHFILSVLSRGWPAAAPRRCGGALGGWARQFWLVGTAPSLITVYVTGMTSKDAQKPPHTYKRHAFGIA